MATSSSLSITQDEIYTYYSLERNLFSRLLFRLMLAPAQCLLLISFWLWLEKMGHKNLIYTMVRLSDSLVHAMVKEAGTCLKALEMDIFIDEYFRNIPMPLTTIVTKKLIDLEIILLSKQAATSGVKGFLKIVCGRAFTDMVEKVVGISSYRGGAENPLRVPGFPHKFFGELKIMPSFRNKTVSPFAGDIWSWNMYTDVSIFDRMLFLTFSRGYPVSVSEVMAAFYYKFGNNSVQSIEMQRPRSNEQPLYCKVVVTSVIVLDMVLEGKYKKKLKVNGKHIWARKYERRDY